MSLTSAFSEGVALCKLENTLLLSYSQGVPPSPLEPLKDVRCCVRGLVLPPLGRQR